MEAHPSGPAAIWLEAGSVLWSRTNRVVKRFGAFTASRARLALSYPLPVETVLPSGHKHPEDRSRIPERCASSSPSARALPSHSEESHILTGDENIIEVQFTVQFMIEDAPNYLFNIENQAKTVKDAAEAATREVIGYNKIDAALTDDKTTIQNDILALLQRILDSYDSGIKVMAVQLQDVHPPKQVIDSFKDVASAKEDKSRFINEAEAYENDLIPALAAKQPPF